MQNSIGTFSVCDWQDLLSVIKHVIFDTTVGVDGICGSGQIGTVKTRGWKMQEWTYRHDVARVDNAGAEISAPCGRGGQYRSGLITTVWQGWTTREVRLT